MKASCLMVLVLVGCHARVTTAPKVQPPAEPVSAPAPKPLYEVPSAPTWKPLEEPKTAPHGMKELDAPKQVEKLIVRIKGKEKSPSGLDIVVGILENNTGKNAPSVVIEIEYFDGGGDRVRQDYVCTYNLGSGKRYRFKVLTLEAYASFKVINVRNNIGGRVLPWEEKPWQ